MNSDHRDGMADKAKGTAKSVAGEITGDRQLQAEGAFDKATGVVRDAIGNVRDAANDAGRTISAKASEVGDKVRETVEDRAGPLLEQVGDKTMEYGRDARDAVAAGAASASNVVRGHPIVTFGLVALLAFLMGRITAPEPKAWYRRDRR